MDTYSNRDRHLEILTIEIEPVFVQVIILSTVSFQVSPLDGKKDNIPF